MLIHFLNNAYGTKYCFFLVNLVPAMKQTKTSREIILLTKSAGIATLEVEELSHIILMGSSNS